jgi:hypothetical protein
MEQWKKELIEEKLKECAENLGITIEECKKLWLEVIKDRWEVKNMHWECKYCDGVRAAHPYGDKEEPLVCASCGAEWEDAKILVKDEEYIED